MLSRTQSLVRVSILPEGGPKLFEVRREKTNVASHDPEVRYLSPLHPEVYALLADSQKYGSLPDCPWQFTTVSAGRVSTRGIRRCFYGFFRLHSIGICEWWLVCPRYSVQMIAPVPRLSGRRGRLLYANCIEDLNCSSLHMLETLEEKLRITVIELDVVASRRTRIESDRLADDERCRLRFGFANPLGRCGATVALVKQLVGYFVHESRELLGR
jgi:hypothetical protein